MAKGPRHLIVKSGRFYARLRVPDAVRPFLGKREFITPLGPDRKTALDALPAAVAAMKAEIAAAERQLAKPRPDYRPALSPRRQMAPAEIAHDHLTRQLAFDSAIRDTGHEAITLGFPDEDYVRQLRELVAGRIIDPLPGPIAAALDNARERGNLTNEPATIRLLARSELLVLETGMHRDEGEPDPAIPAELIPAPREATPAQHARIIGRDSTKTLSELLPRFASEKNARPGTANEYAVAVRMFEEFLSEPKPAFEITRQTIIDYKNALTETPSNYTMRFPGMTLPEAIKANKARKQPFPPLNATTISDKWLARLHSLFAWCVANAIMPDNPAAGVKVDRAKGATKPARVPFTPTDLTKIFGTRVADPEKHWMMLIALFTGMRASEIAQLKLDSIRHERAVLVFAIEEEVKNAGSRRIVPVHSTLLALGLEKRIAELRQAGEERLFPKWFAQGQKLMVSSSRTVNQPYANFLPRWFIRTYLPDVKVPAEGRVFHSFRHTLKSALARAGVPRSISDEITGHDDESSGAGYIHDSAVEAMSEALEKVIFDGFKSENMI